MMKKFVAAGVVMLSGTDHLWMSVSATEGLTQTRRLLLLPRRTNQIQNW